MKYALLLPLLVGLCFTGIGCSNRKDFIASLDVKPQIKIRVGDSLFHTYQDSVKINPRLNGFAAVSLTFSGSDGITGLTYRQVLGTGDLQYQGKTTTGNTLNPVGGQIVLKYIPLIPGRTEYHFLVKDKFQGADSAIYKVLSFINLPPFAKFLVVPLKVNDPLEYQVDASGSLDQDRHFGGGIIQYVFFVNNQIIKTSQPTIKYIFPSSGQYTISVQVTDNDTVSSDLSTRTILIN